MKKQSIVTIAMLALSATQAFAGAQKLGKISCEIMSSQEGAITIVDASLHRIEWNLYPAKRESLIDQVTIGKDSNSAKFVIDLDSVQENKFQYFYFQMQQVLPAQGERNTRTKVLQFTSGLDFRHAFTHTPAGDKLGNLTYVMTNLSIAGGTSFVADDLKLLAHASAYPTPVSQKSGLAQDTFGVMLDTTNDQVFGQVKCYKLK